MQALFVPHDGRITPLLVPAATCPPTLFSGEAQHDLYCAEVRRHACDADVDGPDDRSGWQISRLPGHCRMRSQRRTRHSPARTNLLGLNV